MSSRSDMSAFSIRYTCQKNKTGFRSRWQYCRELRWHFRHLRLSVVLDLYPVPLEPLLPLEVWPLHLAEVDLGVDKAVEEHVVEVDLAAGGLLWIWNQRKE